MSLSFSGFNCMVNSDLLAAPTPRLPIPVLGPATLLKSVATSGCCKMKSSIFCEVILFCCTVIDLSYSKFNLNFP